MRKTKDMRFANNYGGIVNLGKKRRKPYAVRVTAGWENGKQKYKYLNYFESRIKAFEFLVEYNKNPYDTAARKITLNELYVDWSNKHFQDISENTTKSYTMQYKKLEALYNTPFYLLKAKDYQDIFDKNKTDSGLKTLKNVIGMLYKYAITHEIVEKDYSTLIKLPKYKPKNEKVLFTLDEINLLWKHIDKEMAQMLLILLYTGMRITELLIMETANIDLEKRIMVGGIKTDNGKERVIPIHKKIAPIIEANMNGQKYLFETKLKSYSTYQNAKYKFNQLSKELNFSHIIHETRHTFVSQCDRLGLNQTAVQKIIGHATQDFTNKVYNHKNIEDLIKVIDNFKY